ncbi:MAG TPA: hypothetical protein VFP78_22875 [Solirubrobacteraceae bacterium]|nr:hypothetical protein [Solirubrobacteraceae bacterium]
MAVPRLRVPTALPGGSLRQAAGLVSDEVELYHRTYTTLLRSSGETLLRVLEPSHRSMNSSLHPLASTNEVDLGAFLYAMRRLPAGVWESAVIVMGQEAQVFERAGVGRIEEWEPVEAPARRRRWFDSHQGTMAVLLASTSDLDDVIPTLVAYQVEWSKLHAILRSTDRPEGEELDPAACAETYGGNEDDWIRIREAWGDLSTFLDEVRGRKLNLRIRMLGGSQAGYARMTRRWWRPVRTAMEEQGLGERPVYFVSSNPHSMVNLVTPTARSGEAEVVRFIEEHGPQYLREELERFREGRAEGSWENLLYFGARLLWESLPEDGEQWRRRQEAERALGVTHISSKAALRISSQIMALDRLDPAGLDPRLGPVDGDRLARSNAVVVNVEYPLGLAAYNILRELTVSTDVVRGVYVLGKAATLNADVGDVLISSVIHDEHSGSTYWLDNAFSFDDIAPFLRFGSGLDNQRAVTVKSTFLQNREYLDFYYREAYTVVEMEAGPFCNAVYEIADADRYPVGEAVNFSKLPIDFGIIHYASDTPYTQARTLGARGLSYYGMDSTYASSLAILRRIFTLEGILESPPGRFEAPG